MKTLKEISKTGIPDTKWCSEEDVKKMFDDFVEKLKWKKKFECEYRGIAKKLFQKHNEIIDKLSKEVMGE